MPDTTDDTDRTGPDGDLLGGRYRLGESLGRGGMADVFRADDVLLGREVAVKVVRSGTDGVEADGRVRGEVSVLAALNHPSLVTLYDAQLDTEPPYLVMELVEGPTLTARIAASPLTPDAAAIMAAELGEALHVAHTAGVVHRDVKPSNVLLAPSHLPDRAFRAKLADFGIAYLVDTARVTTPGDVIGTAAYLAPEQVRGVDPAPPADVYALGLVLIEALSGNRPFPDAGGVATALARLESPPQIPESLDPAWQDLLRDMTRIDPDQRPSALDVAMRAHSLGSGRPADAATELLPAASPAAEPESRPALAPTSVLAATAAGGAAAGAATTRALPVTPHATAPEATAAGSERSDDAGRRRRRTAWIAAAAAAALVAGTGGILALTSGGDDTTPTDPAPVTEPTPGVTGTAPAADDPAQESADVDVVNDTDPGGDEQDSAPEPEESTPAPEDDTTTDDGASDDAPTDGTDTGVTDGGDGTVPSQPSPDPVDDTITDPDPVDTPTPEPPAPSAPAPIPSPTPSG